MRLSKLVSFFSSPRVALIIFVLFLVGYIAFIDLEGGFSKTFLHFGPSPDANFLGIKVDSWTKVSILYLIGFLSSLITTYYSTVMESRVHFYVTNPEVDNIPLNKTLTYSIVLLEPLFIEILQIIQFFTDLTMQLQFILPQFIGSFIGEIPFVVGKLGSKTFNEMLD
jgi:uncharacterized membrane protein